MKIRGLLLTIILLAGISRIANSQNNCNQPPCGNGTNTNPNPIYNSPQTSDFRQNTFDWRDASFPVNKNGFTSFLPNGSFPYLNPFQSQADYLFGLGTDKLDNGRDNRPEDGWELIKQDFGYAYHNGQWNGTTLPTIENNQVIAQPSILNYFILYNKYTGVLRVLGSHPNQANDYSGIIAHIEIVHEDLENFENKSNYEDYKANGLFALNSPISTALDKQTKNLVISAIAISPTTNAQFFYADFQMSYDPCICLFEGGLRFSFETLREADITMAGKAIRANIDVAKLNTNGGSLNFFNLGFNPQIAVGQINPNGSDREAQVQSIMQHYQDLEKLISKMESAGATSSEIDEIKKGLKLLGAIATGGKLAALKVAVETMSKFIDFGTYDETKNKTKFKSSVVTSYLELVGQVITREFQHGCEFYLATPGSCGAESRDEYTKQDGNGVIPMYPMYSEPLGLFALMTTPKITRSKKNDNPDPDEFERLLNNQLFNGQSCIKNNVTHVFFPSGIKRIINNDKATYKMQDLGFDFAFNSIIDIDKTVIDAALEVNDIGDIITPCEINETQDIFGVNCSMLDQKNGISRFRTAFVPLECINELVFQTGHSFTGDQWRYNLKVNEARSKAFIIFNIYYVFKEDAYGKVHSTIQTIKYPLEILETEDDLTLHPNFSYLKNMNKGNLTIHTTTHTSRSTNSNDKIILTEGDIFITGNQINNLVHSNPSIIPKVRIIATGKIEVESGVEIGQNIVLEAGGRLSNIICDGKQKLNSMTPAMLASHCNSENYKAKEVAPAAYGLPPSQSISQNNSRMIITNKAAISPNPNTGSFVIEFNNNLEIDANLSVQDITGREVYNNILAKNKKYYAIENTKLTSGIYFVSITNNNEKQTIKIIIQN